jgi:hypothetical protein
MHVKSTSCLDTIGATSPEFQRRQICHATAAANGNMRIRTESQRDSAGKRRDAARSATIQNTTRVHTAHERALVAGSLGAMAYASGREKTINSKSGPVACVTERSNAATAERLKCGHAGMGMVAWASKYGIVNKTRTTATPDGNNSSSQRMRDVGRQPDRKRKTIAVPTAPATSDGGSPSATRELGDFDSSPRNVSSRGATANVATISDTTQ